MQIHVKFMEVLQLEGISSVLQFEIKLYIIIKSYCIKLLSRQQNSISGCILKLVSKPVMLVLITYLFMLYMQSCRQGNKKGTVLWYSVLYTGCPRRKGPNFGRVFLRSNYTDITQNTYIQSSMVTEILNIEK